jgi:hypothetical protein
MDTALTIVSRMNHLFHLALNSPLDPTHNHGDTALLLESGPDAGDASNIYPISDKKTHNKRLLIDAFDISMRSATAG